MPSRATSHAAPAMGGADQSEQSHALLDHAWRYFELHAKQRMTTFNFYLVISGAIATGLAATLQGSNRLAWLGSVALGVLLALVAFLFWKLDQRVAFLVKHAEAALAAVESTFRDGKAQVFLTEPNATECAKKNDKGDGKRFWIRQWTYGCCQ